MAKKEIDPEVLYELALIRKDLQAAGSPFDDLDYLANTGEPYTSPIQVLIEWLPRAQTIPIRTMIVRALTVKEAKRLAGKALIAEFERALQKPPEKSDLLWVIGNALYTLGGATVSDDIVRFLKDPRSGRARQMLSLAAARAKNRSAIPVLIDLLDEPGIIPFAAEALGLLRAHEALPKIQAIALSGEGNSWFRRQLRNALKRLGVKEVDASSN